MSDDRIHRLQRLGLTENQAKAYTALLRLGKTSASTLNKMSKVPRNKVYAVMEELSDKGLVHIILEDPICFEPRPIGDYIRRLASDIDSDRDRLNERAERLRQVFRIVEQPDADDLKSGSFRIHKGRRAAVQQHHRMNEHAKHSVRVLLSKASAKRSIDGRGLSEVGPDENVTVEAYTPLDDDNKAAVHALAQRLGARLRVVNEGPDNLIIKLIDDREVLFTHVIPDTASLTVGEDIAVWTDNPVFIELARQLLDRARNRSQSVATAMAVLDGDAPPRALEVVTDPVERRRRILKHISRSATIDLIGPARAISSAVFGLLGEEALDVAIERGVRIRAITNPDPEVLQRIPEGLDIDVRFIDDPPANFRLFEDLVMYAHEVDVEAQESSGWFTIFSTLPMSLKEARTLFDRLWVEALPAAASATASRTSGPGARP